MDLQAGGFEVEVENIEAKLLRPSIYDSDSDPEWWSQEKAQDKRGCKADWDISVEDPEANQEDEERVKVTLLMTER